ncbi:MAG TPA: tRNA-dihydrouridine synthase [Nitrospiraceae bacterium]|jgi:tRNA-dihydrouridine synthase|nr:tRNA-dihydrouridine synthase [Nitrospiraceae bacterium]
MSFWDSLSRPIIGLAPMDGVTDAAFRKLVAEQGRPDVLFTEFTHVNHICRGPDFLVETLRYSEVERPIVAQLYGKDPELFYIAAHAVCELGFDGLDINMGCPSRNVASSGCGAGLIRTPALARAIIRAARQGILDWSAGQTPEQAGLKPARADFLRAMNIARNGHPTVPRRVIPLSVKTRLGYDCVIVEDWIAHLVEERPAVISVHGRTLRQMYQGEADWNAIARAARIVSGSGTLLLGNGDVMSMRQVVRRVLESGVHGVLVGRGALGAPWVFRTKDLAKREVWSGQDGADRLSGPLDVAVSMGERFRVMMAHARQFYALCGPERFPRMRKHLGWYCKGFPTAAAMRAKMFQASSPADVERIIAEFAPLAGVGRDERSNSSAHARSSSVLSVI